MSKSIAVTGSKNTTYDRESFAKLVGKLKGGRSIPKMAADTGVSVSFLSKALSKSLPSRPSRRTLIRLSDPNTRPQADVTYSHLLTSCGYAAEEESECAADMNAGFPYPMSVAEAVAFYYDSAPITQAMSMLTNALIMKGIGPQLDVRFRTSYFQVEDKSKDFYCVGISGFCQDKAGIQAMEMVIKSKIFDALCAEEDQKTMGKKIFYIMVDDDELFVYCKEKLPCVQTCKMVILYTADHLNIKEEYIKVSEPKDTLFPKSLI